jgi:hypothetical protein
VRRVKNTLKNIVKNTYIPDCISKYTPVRNILKKTTVSFGISHIKVLYSLFAVILLKWTTFLSSGKVSNICFVLQQT